MSKPAAADPAASALAERTAPSPEEIRTQLRRVLASPAFLGSKRCQQFLQYVCEKALARENGSLKERTIAIEVFGRSPQSELGEDTIVRVGAREVRKRLAQYYVTEDGAAAEVRIDLPSGAYSPEFRYNRSFAEPEAPPPAVEAVPPPRPHRRGLIAALAVCALAGAGLAAVKLAAPGPNAEMFQKFWAPVLQSPEPLLLAVAHPIVYHASRRAVKLSEAYQPPQDGQGQQAIRVPPERLDGSDMVPVFNQYVGFGDMVVANEVTAMLARKSRPVRLRLATGVEFADMRKSPTLLIGAVTNRWTVELQQAWRFRFTHMPDTRLAIEDTASAQQWSMPSKDDGSVADDYILVSRIRNSITGGTVMVAAGLKQYGTEAAGHLLTDPEQLGQILRKLPKGWESKNLQVILHARVIGNTPAQPEVVAAHVW